VTRPGVGGVIPSGEEPRVQTERATKERYGPGPWLYVAALCFSALLVVSIHGHRFYVAAGALGVLFVVLQGWVFFEVSPDGLRRFGICMPRRVAWEEIAAVRGRAEGVDPVLVQWVLDREGKAIFMLTPWLARRRHLVLRILDELAARRQAEGERGRGRPR
jgi:hypothetical protein